MSNTPEKYVMTLRMPRELYVELCEYTENTGSNVTEFVRRACREKLDREKKNTITPLTKEDLRTAIVAELTEMLKDGTYSALVAKGNAKNGIQGEK